MVIQQDHNLSLTLTKVLSMPLFSVGILWFAALCGACYHVDPLKKEITNLADMLSASHTGAHSLGMTVSRWTKARLQINGNIVAKYVTVC